MITKIEKLQTIQANATIVLSNFSISTPDILNINVTRTRGQAVNSASVAFTFKGELILKALDNSKHFPLVIFFYGNPIFTGIAKRLSISPSARCADEIIVRVQGEDILYKLENRNFTRRQKLPGLGPICFISSLSNRRTSLGFDDPPSRFGIDSGASPIEYMTHSINPAEQINMKSDTNSILGPGHPITKLADPIQNSNAGTGGIGGFIIHDHSSMSLDEHGGGPAVGVFGIK